MIPEPLVGSVSQYPNISHLEGTKNAMKQNIPLKELLPLLGLTVCAFLFNTSEFIPIGLLTDIAAAFELTEAKAGMMITIYSWAVTILSLPLMLLVCKLDYRRMLLGVVGFFAACQVLSAIAPNFAILVLSRLGVACTHAIFWSIASPVAVQVVSEKYRTFALSMIVTGSSVAMILGMPLGRIIGLSFGWRMTFAFVAIVAIIAVVYMLRFFPKIPGSQSFTLVQLPSLLKNRILISIYIYIALIATGYYTGYSYIEPFLKQVAGLADNTITVALTLFGVAGLLGSFLFSKCYTKMRYTFLIVSSFALAGALYLLGPASLAGGVAAMALCAFWGIAATSFNVAFQSELIKYSPQDASAIAMSIYSGIFNLGIGCGTGLGGAVSTHVSLQWIGLVGGVIATLAACFCAFWIVRLMRQNP